MRPTLLLSFLFFALSTAAQNPTDLWLRGYSVIPTPRSVQLAEGDVQLDASWLIQPEGLDGKSISVRSLSRDLESFHGLTLKQGSQAQRVIRLQARAGAVMTKAAPELDRQGYRIRIEDGVIEVTGNTDQGLFYGVQTLSQLVKRDAGGTLVVPKGVIEDWPHLQLRFLHWDTKHHQDRLETLKRYLDWSARFKINMIGL